MTTTRERQLALFRKFATNQFPDETPCAVAYAIKNMDRISLHKAFPESFTQKTTGVAGLAITGAKLFWEDKCKEKRPEMAWEQVTAGWKPEFGNEKILHEDLSESKWGYSESERTFHVRERKENAYAGFYHQISKEASVHRGITVESFLGGIPDYPQLAGLLSKFFHGVLWDEQFVVEAKYRVAYEIKLVRILVDEAGDEREDEDFIRWTRWDDDDESLKSMLKLFKSSTIKASNSLEGYAGSFYTVVKYVRPIFGMKIPHKYVNKQQGERVGLYLNHGKQRGD
jgi:hypothetical protein